MNSYITKPWLIVIKLPDGINYFCGWERLAPESPVFGIVWDTDIEYAHVFKTKAEAKRMRSRMREYDSRQDYYIVPDNRKNNLLPAW